MVRAELDSELRCVMASWSIEPMCAKETEEASSGEVEGEREEGAGWNA